jgi:hypothetical protein
MKKTIILAAMLAVPLLVPRQILAQSRSITIIPPKYELFGNPGDQIVEKMRVKNDSDTPITYEVLVEDFASAGEEGAVVLEEGQSDAQYSLAKWLETETKDLILQPGEERSFTFTINIPRIAEPGGHYASVLFQAPGANVPGAAAVAQRVGALVLLRVSGNVVEKATIENFLVPGYSQKTPVNISLRMKNEGNTHIRPKGTIIITNLFGQKIDELPLNGQNVLPGATRVMATEWTKSNVMGYYTATMVGTYGQQNLPLTAAAKFLVISPIAAALIVAAAISGLLIIIGIISGKSRLLKAIQVIISGK